MPNLRVVLAAMMIGGAVASATPAAAQTGGDGRPKKDWTASPPGVPALQGFSVVLVVGDMSGDSNPDDVPPAAKRALKDMRDFLPYKSYRLLDTAWILGSSGPRSATRLRGVDRQEYELSLTAEPVSAIKLGSTRLQASFRLAEATTERRAAAAEDQNDEVEKVRKLAAGLNARRAEVEARYDAIKEQLNPNHPDVREARRAFEVARAHAEDARRRLEMMSADTRRHAQESAAAVKAGRALIDTGFAIDVGETVVVGTSHLGGGQKALIALLTAVPRGKS